MDTDALKAELDHLMRDLRHCNTQPTAVAWMKRAYLAMEECHKYIDRPKVFAIPGSFGVPTFVLAPPKSLELPRGGMKPRGPVWFEGKTTVYDQNFFKAFTRVDTRRLEKIIAERSLT